MNLKKKYSIECFEILQIYLCINNEYKVIFSDENIRFSASYSPSSESLEKKSSPTAAVIVAFTVFEIEKNKNFMKLEYIFYTMTLDYEKNRNATKGRIFENTIKILLNNLMVFGLEKLYFSFNHETGGALYRKTNTQ